MDKKSTPAVGRRWMEEHGLECAGSFRERRKEVSIVLSQ